MARVGSPLQPNSPALRAKLATFMHIFSHVSEATESRVLYAHTHISLFSQFLPHVAELF